MLPALALLAATLAQDLRDTEGKTNAQILAMGHDAWTRFYLKRVGETTMGMAYAEKGWSDALGARNERLLRGRKDAKTLGAVRKALQAFTNDAVEAGKLGTGGGSMWYGVANAYQSDLETAVYRMMVPGRPAPHRVTSDVARELAALRRGLAAPDLLPEDRPKVGPAMARLEGDWKAVSALASTLDRRRSDLALEFCRATLRDARETVAPK